FFILLFSLTAIGLQAQTLERQVIGSAGAYQTAAWGSLSTTAGENVINTFTTSSFILTQGFQQPMIGDLIVYDVPSNNMSVKVYPNPAGDVINVEINTDNANKHYSVTLVDLPGQLLKLPYRDLSSGMNTSLTFDLRPIAAGPYLILISDERNVRVKTIKFTKIN
ncbi:MAG: T9SS type A sorting domain-containing protein, partial [Chitinophagales bacterium]